MSSERGSMALVEFEQSRVEGRKVDLKGVHAFLSEDGIWIDLFVGKADYVPADADLLESILRSVRLGAPEAGPS